MLNSLKDNCSNGKQLQGKSNKSSSAINQLYSFSDIPMTSLQYGANLNPNSIKEGDDIYFECIVQARPQVTKLQWYQNVSMPLYCDHGQL
jgi:hypothetical protein